MENNFLENDSLLEEAKKRIIWHNRVSVSLLQRGLQIGYARASYLLEKLLEIGFIEETETPCKYRIKK